MPLIPKHKSTHNLRLTCTLSTAYAQLRYGALVVEIMRNGVKRVLGGLP